MKPKTYKIKLSKSMLNCINEDNIDNFIGGLDYALRNYLFLVKMGKLATKKDGKNTDFVISRGMVYIDDGKQDNKTVIEPESWSKVDSEILKEKLK